MVKNSPVSGQKPPYETVGTSQREPIVLGWSGRKGGEFIPPPYGIAAQESTLNALGLGNHLDIAAHTAAVHQASVVVVTWDR